jgi:hypothetical protein
MNRRIQKTGGILLVLGFLAAMAGCHGGGHGGAAGGGTTATVSGVSTPASVSVVTAN